MQPLPPPPPTSTAVPVIWHTGHTDLAAHAGHKGHAIHGGHAYIVTYSGNAWHAGYSGHTVLYGSRTAVWLGDSLLLKNMRIAVEIHLYNKNSIKYSLPLTKYFFIFQKFQSSTNPGHFCNLWPDTLCQLFLLFWDYCGKKNVPCLSFCQND